jgi:prepilin-type N-terminal cleavage/methylation domain-containing protein
VLRPRIPTFVGVRDERGFGMIELLCAMTVMLIGIFAVYAVFQAGIVQIRRASTITTAAAVADAEMEKYRAIRYDSIGLADTDVAATDATYKADTSLYQAETSPSTTVASAMTASQLTVPVSSAAGFPASATYIVKIDSELILVSGGAGTTTWTVRDVIERGYLGTTATTHSAGAAVTQKQRVNVTKCGSAPCTNTVPTKTVTGADGRAYRVDTYVTWRQIGNSASTTGRLVKLVTVIVRDNASPYRKWARVDSSFDESTGV